MDSIKILISISSTIINFVLGFFYFYLIRMFFDIQIIGLYGTILSFLSIFSFITDLGFSTAYLKFYSQSQNIEEKRDCNGTFIFFRIIQYTIFSTIVSILIFFVPIHVERDVIYLFFFGDLLKIIGFNTIFFIFLGNKQVTKKLISLVISELVKISIIIILMIFYPNEIQLLAYGNLISKIILITLLSFLLRDFKVKLPSKNKIKKFLKFTYPFFFISASNVIVANIDILLIQNWYSIEDVANYYTAKEMFRFFEAFLISAAYVLLPTISSNIIMRDEYHTISSIKIIHKYLNTLFSMIYIIVLVSASPLIVLVFGQEYQLSSYYLVFFILLLTLNSVEFGIKIYLQSMEKILVLMYIFFINNILSIFLMFIMMSPAFFHLGPVGGIIALILGNLLTQVVYQPVINKKYSLRFYWGFFLNLSLLIGLTLIHSLIDNVLEITLLHIPLFLGAYLALFFILNIIFKLLTREDFSQFKKIINPKNILKTILSEFEN